MAIRDQQSTQFGAQQKIETATARFAAAIVVASPTFAPPPNDTEVEKDAIEDYLNYGEGAKGFGPRELWGRNGETTMVLLEH